jgi:hypothetical protein
MPSSLRIALILAGAAAVAWVGHPHRDFGASTPPSGVQSSSPTESLPGQGAREASPQAATAPKDVVALPSIDFGQEIRVASTTNDPKLQLMAYQLTRNCATHDQTRKDLNRHLLRVKAPAAEVQSINQTFDHVERSCKTVSDQDRLLAFDMLRAAAKRGDVGASAKLHWDQSFSVQERYSDWLVQNVFSDAVKGDQLSISIAVNLPTPEGFSRITHFSMKVVSMFGHVARVVGVFLDSK